MKLSGCLLILLVAGGLATGRAEVGKESWWRVFGKIEEGVFSGGHADESDEEIGKFLKRTEFDEWEVYEDELVRLEYPKHPLLKFRKEGGKEGIQVEGGVCTTVDNSFQTAYVLEAGSATYGVFLLNPASWLDDGICLCGPMVHHVYRVEDGCLARFSLLPGGAVKKAQVLGDKLRLMAFEWTHLACPRDVYERMVERMTLKIPHRMSRRQLETEVARRYGFEGRTGWLHPGMTVSGMEKAMGGAGKEFEEGVCWEGRLGDYEGEMRVAVSDGIMTRLLTEGPERNSSIPVKGTGEWVGQAVNELIERKAGKEDGGDTDSEGKGANAEPRISTTIAEVKDAILVLAGDPKANWYQVCDSIETMATGLEETDERILKAVLDREDLSYGTHEVLKAYGYEGRQKWLEDALETLLTKEPGEGDLGWMVRELGEFDKGKAAEKTMRFFKQGPVWWEEVIEAADCLSPEQKQEVIVAAIQESQEKKSGPLAWAVLRMLENGIELKDPEAVSELIGKYPEGEGWDEMKSKVLKALAGE